MSRILVVDDDDDIRESLASFLEGEGHTVATAQDGLDLIQGLRAPMPELILADIMMPEMDGLEACRVLKNSTKFRHIPILLMSARHLSPREQGAFLQTNRADGYFSKPLQLEALLRRMNEVLGIPEAILRP